MGAFVAFFFGTHCLTTLNYDKIPLANMNFINGRFYCNSHHQGFPVPIKKGMFL